MKIAFYGRYSSDSQRDTSIEDQRRVVQRWAEQHGHEIAATFSDSAISGANIRLLTGLQTALAAACTRPAPVRRDCCRSTLAAVPRCRRHRRDHETSSFFGVRVIAVADGLTPEMNPRKSALQSKVWSTNCTSTTFGRRLSAASMVSSSRATATGGRTYGYRSEPVYEATSRTDPHGNPIPVGYRITIVLEEAAVVRQVFQCFRDGLGEKTIAKHLNACFAGRTWRPNTIYLMLQNPKYVGPTLLQSSRVAEESRERPKVYRWRRPRPMGIRHHRSSPDH